MGLIEEYPFGEGPRTDIRDHHCFSIQHVCSQFIMSYCSQGKERRSKRIITLGCSFTGVCRPRWSRDTQLDCLINGQCKPPGKHWQPGRTHWQSLQPTLTQYQQWLTVSVLVSSPDPLSRSFASCMQFVGGVEWEGRQRARERVWGRDHVSPWLALMNNVYMSHRLPIPNCYDF